MAAASEMWCYYTRVGVAPFLLRSLNGVVREGILRNTSPASVTIEMTELKLVLLCLCECFDPLALAFQCLVVDVTSS